MEIEKKGESFGYKGSGVGDFIKLVKQRPYLVTIGLVGGLLLGVGILSAAMIANRSSESEIEIVSIDDDKEGEVFVDVSGAVMEPGLYKLTGGARVNDALAEAGGLSGKADRDWFNKNINLASKVEDGAKIYILSTEETKATGPTAGRVQGVAAGSQVSSKININTASASQLDILWGVGPATAEKIITNRPYSSIEELKTKKVLKSNVYERIKDEVSLY